MKGTCKQSEKSKFVRNVAYTRIRPCCNQGVGTVQRRRRRRPYADVYLTMSECKDDIRMISFSSPSKQPGVVYPEVLESYEMMKEECDGQDRQTTLQEAI
ncbi:hypothetical protein V3C99_002809 [Haemonchus contortus]|uniref:Expressed conserved protein n=1 Tax=Haemonchus contortus TaxID=6289 RepID=A0A7I4Y9U7_HAECO